MGALPAVSKGCEEMRCFPETTWVCISPACLPVDLGWRGEHPWDKAVGKGVALMEAPPDSGQETRYLCALGPESPKDSGACFLMWFFVFLFPFFWHHLRQPTAPNAQCESLLSNKRNPLGLPWILNSQLVNILVAARALSPLWGFC